ncbi:hypothetical protein AALP_AAs50735U000200 [Arabis alpina]|uniref:Uncharacterized protein n=1 Tax=Arabis alpina TaxID=50452 RepID=A0A087FZE2_ARAAL|nr:hypothetical protein AALP_AAs50735U000200 [Arabis alpina]
MEQVKIEVIRREVVKPSLPSPQDRLRLSIFDLSLPAYVPIIFFYKAEDLVSVSPEIITRNLKSSLSETLSRFYPLAGRVEGVSINCNDEGVVFTEARTDLLLPEFLKNININSLDRFSPTSPGDSPNEWPLLCVMVTFFGSGSGVAVSVSFSHMICDAPSMLTFLKNWATTAAKGKSNDPIHFAETTIYPPPPPPHVSLPSPSMDHKKANLTSKFVINRFVFESSRIAELKRKAASETVPVPTRVEAISALIWRCARNALRSNLLVPRPTLMLQAMNLRLRIPSTVLSRDAVGNLQTTFFLKKGAESDLEICETVATFRKAKEEVNDMIKENLQGSTLGQYLLRAMGLYETEVKPEIDRCSMSSWCRMPFYEVDFGWGSPVWIGLIFDNPRVRIAWLIDSKDGEGVEACIILPEQDMSVFIRDQEFLAYAILNPPVLT